MPPPPAPLIPSVFLSLDQLPRWAAGTTAAPQEEEATVRRTFVELRGLCFTTVSIIKSDEIHGARLVGSAWAEGVAERVFGIEYQIYVHLLFRMTFRRRLSW